MVARNCSKVIVHISGVCSGSDDCSLSVGSLGGGVWVVLPLGSSWNWKNYAGFGSKGQIWLILVEKEMRELYWRGNRG